MRVRSPTRHSRSRFGRLASSSAIVGTRAMLQRPKRRGPAIFATAATAAEDGHYSTNPLLSVNENPSDAPPNAGAEEVAAATGNE